MTHHQRHAMRVAGHVFQIPNEVVFNDSAINVDSNVELRQTTRLLNILV
jgi:hypothetical protein